MSNIGTVRTIRARLEKLEQMAGQAEARQILVRNGKPLSDAELAACLEGESVVVGPDDMVLRTIAVYEASCAGSGGSGL